MAEAFFIPSGGNNAMKLTKVLKIKILQVIIIVIAASGCKKKDESEKTPKADFTTDKSEYYAGETVYLTNTSSDQASSAWNLPDGRKIISENTSFKIKETSTDTKLNFKLDVFSESKSKYDFCIKSVTVKPLVGRLVLYDGYYGGDVTITIDGQTVGIVRLPPSPNLSTPAVVPDCGQSGYPTYTLSTGTHTVKAQCIVYNTTNTVNISNNQCTVLRVF